LQGPAGIHLIMVCDRRGAVQSAPQRDEIAERLENEQVDRLARRYLRDLRKQAFVDIRL
jgi:peptidyl-prolyl cis-trans isomerase SurA